MITPDGLPAMRAALARDGYVIVRDVLSMAEIVRLRATMLRHFAGHWTWEGLGKHQPNAALEVPDTAWLFAHGALLAILRGLTGSPRLVFTTNCDMHMNMLSWWHKDTGEGRGGCFKGDYFAKDDLAVYRVGLYLQDHDRDGNGFRVRCGSHRVRSVEHGPVEALRTRCGDIVVFDIRLTHAGQLPDLVELALLKTARRLALPSLGYRLKEGWRRSLGKQEKLSVFFTYGAPGADTDDFCAFEAAEKRRLSDGALTVSPDLIAALRAERVTCNSWTVPA